MSAGWAVVAFIALYFAGWYALERWRAWRKRCSFSICRNPDLCRGRCYADIASAKDPAENEWPD